LACPEITGLAAQPSIVTPPVLNATVPVAVTGDAEANRITPGTPTPAFPLEVTATEEPVVVTGGAVVVVTGGAVVVAVEAVVVMRVFLVRVLEPVVLVAVRVTV